MSSGHIVGVVNRFGRVRERYRIGSAFDEAGVRWIPLELGTLSLSPHGDVRVDRPGSTDLALDELGLDAVLWRISENDSSQCLPLLTAMARSGPRLINSLDTIQTCSSKWATYLALTAAGVPCVSTTWVAPGAPIPELGPMVVVKPDQGAGGCGVEVVDPWQAEPAERAVLVQPRFGDGTEHRRTLVCGGRAVASVVRLPAPGKAVNNVEAGGTAVVVPLGGEGPIAEAAARVVGADVAGVDLVPDGGTWRVLEVNSCPGIEALALTGAAVSVVSAVLDVLEPPRPGPSR